MEEQKSKQDIVKLGHELVDHLNDILSTGDWESSMFLQTTATKLKDLRDKVKKACGDSDAVDAGKSAGKDQVSVPEGYLRVFILLYQADGTNLQNWFNTIKALGEYSSGRSVYGDEKHIQEFIRSKSANIESNGYVVVDIKHSDLFQEGDQVNSFDHKLLGLKEGAVKMENIREFIHANKKRYAIREKELEFLGEI